MQIFLPSMLQITKVVMLHVILITRTLLEFLINRYIKFKMIIRLTLQFIAHKRLKRILSFKTDYFCMNYTQYFNFIYVKISDAHKGE